MIRDQIALKAVLCGFGGQGVIFMTRLIAQTAMRMGHSVIASETHGMSQRGGSVLSHLMINGTESALIRRGTADVLFAMDTIEALRCMPYLRDGSVAFSNSGSEFGEEIRSKLGDLGIGVHSVEASRKATEIGSPAVANVLLIGFACAFPEFPLPFPAIEDTLRSTSSRGLDLNLKSLQAGYEIGLSRLV
jgi:indolepyruvate ferredoxin oxidoreductase beta subunit